jgi:hypothetical protein
VYPNDNFLAYQSGSRERPKKAKKVGVAKSVCGRGFESTRFWPRAARISADLSRFPHSSFSPPGLLIRARSTKGSPEMKQRHMLGSAAVFGLTVFAGSAVLAHGGHHGGGHHSGGHHSSGHHSSGSHHGTAHHAAPHQSAPHHSAPHHAVPQLAGPSHPTHSHVAGHHSVPNHSFAQQNHSWHHHHHGYWNHGYWNNGTWYAGPWNVWDGSVASNDVAPWYYESFFDVAPEAAVQPENGPTVCRGYRNGGQMPTSPLRRPASAGIEESVVTESDGN